MRLLLKVFNIIHEDMVVLYLTLSNIFDNGRPKYSTHINGLIDALYTCYRLHSIAIIRGFRVGYI